MRMFCRTDLMSCQRNQVFFMQTIYTFMALSATNIEGLTVIRSGYIAQPLYVCAISSLHCDICGCVVMIAKLCSGLFLV